MVKPRIYLEVGIQVLIDMTKPRIYIEAGIQVLILLKVKVQSRFLFSKVGSKKVGINK